jgi:hypothetical protein
MADGWRLPVSASRWSEVAGIRRRVGGTFVHRKLELAWRE